MEAGEHRIAPEVRALKSRHCEKGSCDGEIVRVNEIDFESHGKS